MGNGPINFGNFEFFELNSLSPSICLSSVYLSIHLLILLAGYESIFLTIYPGLYLVYLPFVCLSVCLYLFNMVQFLVVSSSCLIGNASVPFFCFSVGAVLPYFFLVQLFQKH